MKESTILIVLAALIVGILGITLWHHGDSSGQLKALISETGKQKKSYPAVGDPDNLTQKVIEKPDGTVQVIFSITQDKLRFNDALNMTQEEYKKLSAQDIQKMAWQRFNNWRTFTEQ